MRKYITKNRVWQVVAGYLAIIALIDFLHVQYNFISGSINISPFISILTAIELFILFLLLFRTKIGYILAILYLVLTTFIKINQLLTVIALIELFKDQGGVPSYLQQNLILAVSIILLQISLVICLLVKKSSRTEVRHARWISPGQLTRIKN
ncbi:hypothetical protein GIX45_10485 [Erwinia sp. CPCC 100877]|nr:hypothetical protein [Erwinia sp. CPCC 100877]